MSRRTIGLSAELQAYVTAHTTGVDGLLRDLADETAERFPDLTDMQIAPEQGALLTFLVRQVRALLAVEVGTFTGYSSVCVARGLPPGGRLVCFDRSEEWTGIARRYWERAGLTERIELRLGDAADTLGSLAGDPPVDFAFIDADKPGYPRYYEALLARLAPHGVLAVDNVLAGGRVLDPAEGDANASAIAAFNERVLADERVDVVLLPVADGVSLITRRSA